MSPLHTFYNYIWQISETTDVLFYQHYINLRSLVSFTVTRSCYWTKQGFGTINSLKTGKFYVYHRLLERVPVTRLCFWYVFPAKIFSIKIKCPSETTLRQCNSLRRNHFLRQFMSPWDWAISTASYNTTSTALLSPTREAMTIFKHHSSINMFSFLQHLPLLAFA